MLKLYHGLNFSEWCSSNNIIKLYVVRLIIYLLKLWDASLVTFWLVQWHQILGMMMRVTKSCKIIFFPHPHPSMYQNNIVFIYNRYIHFLTVFNLPCTEDIPTCMDTCGQMLQCGIHACTQRCHYGPCGQVRSLFFPCEFHIFCKQTQSFVVWSVVVILFSRIEHLK